MSIWLDIFYKPILNLLLALYNVLPDHSLALAIVLLTIIVRIIVLPLGLRAGRVQRKLRKVQPQLAALKEQHKADPQELARAQMAFYKQYKVSPWSSCLPVLLQLPVLFALFRVLNEGLHTINPEHVYSFVHLPEKLNTMFLHIDLGKPDAYVLPILAGATQFILMKISTPPMPKKEKKDGNDMQGNMEQMMANQMTYILPIMTVFFARSFPAGLALYWVVSTLFGIAQQVYVNREKVREVTVRIRHQGSEDVVSIEEK